MSVRVLLVDDVVELRVVVRQALLVRGGFEVVAEAADGAEAIAQAERHQPDVVVLDLGLPDLAGQELLTGLRSAAPEASVVVFTGSASPDTIEPGGVEAFVRKDQEIGYLVDLLVDLSRAGRRSAVIPLGPDVADVARARRFVADHCRSWGCQDVLDDAHIVVTELVTNALVHAGTACELRARMARGVLRLEVIDAGEGVPDPRAAGQDDEHGRGLLLVSVLARAWGVETLPTGGKVVWAELPTGRGEAVLPEELVEVHGEGGRAARRAGGDRGGALAGAESRSRSAGRSPHPARPNGPSTGKDGIYDAGGAVMRPR